MRLTRKMLMGYPRLRRWEQTDDVLQNALIRLHQSLAEVTPSSVAQFLGLAATQIRRSLIDLTRHHLGPEGTPLAMKAISENEAADQKPVQPQSLEQWSEFHATVQALPDKEREVFDLLWYQGLSQSEAADALGVDVRTVKRRWRSARIMIYEALDGQPPE